MPISDSIQIQYFGLVNMVVNFMICFLEIDAE